MLIKMYGCTFYIGIANFSIIAVQTESFHFQNPLHLTFKGQIEWIHIKVENMLKVTISEKMFIKSCKTGIIFVRNVNFHRFAMFFVFCFCLFCFFYRLKSSSISITETPKQLKIGRYKYFYPGVCTVWLYFHYSCYFLCY